MKFKILLFTFCLSISGIAQKSEKVLDQIALQACNCIAELSPEEMTSLSDMQLGLCIITAANPYRETLKAEYNFDLDNLDDNSGTQLGELIGTRMIVNCPDIFMEITRTLTDQDTSEPETKNSVVRTGILNEIRKDQFLSLLITSAGRQYQYLWMEPFQNDFDLTQNPKKYLNQEISIEYTEKEMFDPRIQDYRSFLIISGISLVRTTGK